MASVSGYSSNITTTSMRRPNFPLFFRAFNGKWEGIITLRIARVPHPRSKDSSVSYNKPTDQMPFLRGDSDPKPTYSNLQGSMLMDFYAVPDLFHCYFTPIRHNLPFPYNHSFVTADHIPDPFPISTDGFARLPPLFHFICKQSELDAYMAAAKKVKYGLSTSQRENPLASGSEPPTRHVNASSSGQQGASNPSPVLNPPNVFPQRQISISQYTSSDINDTCARVRPVQRSTSTSTKIIFPRPVPFLAPFAELPLAYDNDLCAYQVSIAFNIKEYVSTSSGELSPATTAELERPLADATRNTRSVISDGAPEHVNISPSRDVVISSPNNTMNNNHTFSRHTENSSSDGTPQNLQECSDLLPKLHAHMMENFFDEFLTSQYVDKLTYEMLSTLEQQQEFNIFAPEMTIANTEIPDNVTHDCCICLSELKVGDLSRILPCGHRMHRDCVDAWFQGSSRCPMCRTEVIPDDLDD